MASDLTRKSLVLERVERHDIYYLETVVFRVEDTLFRVPRRGFELESVIFASMFSLPAGKHNPEGQDDDSPIVLQGVKKRDFQSLLEMMYPMGPNLPNLTHEDRVAVLRLSTMWELVKVRKSIIEMMEKTPLDAVEKILIAKKERISTWLLNGYFALVRENPLTFERVKLLDWETVAKLFAVQYQSKMPEYCEKNRFTGYCTSCGHRYPDNILGRLTPTEGLVERVFGQEIRFIRKEEEEKWRDRGDGDSDMESSDSSDSD